MTTPSVQEVVREDSERVVADLLNERERMLFHLCSMVAERNATGVPDTHTVARARAFLEDMGISDIAMMEIWMRGETGRMQ